MEPAKKKKGRPAAKKPAEKAAPSVKFTIEVDRLLTVQSKQLKVSKNKYADAAVAYFAENGLDPFKAQAQNLANVLAKVDAETLAIRKQNVDIGNRLISILRGWEKNLYAFLQQQQQATYNYLELIESNILQHQVTVETNLLAPMVEQLFKVNLEAFITRGFASHLFLSASGQTTDYAKQMELSTTRRDEQLGMLLRDFLKTNSVPLPEPTVKRAVTPVPAKPVAPAAAAPASPAKS